MNNMNKKILAIGGIVFWLGGISLGIYLWLITSDARSLSGVEQDKLQSGDSCVTALKDVRVYPEIMSKSDSTALTAFLLNSDRNQKCEVVVRLNAPDFHVIGSEPDPIQIVPPRQNKMISWILTPKKSGTFQAIVDTGFLNQKVGIEVTNDEMIPSLAQWWVSFLVYFLGSMLQLPWWLERWEKWKQQKQLKNKTAVQH